MNGNMNDFAIKMRCNNIYMIIMKFSHMMCVE